MGGAGLAARARRWACGGSLILAPLAAAPAVEAAPALVPLGSFAQPTWAGAPAGDTERVFVAERAGRIAVIQGGVASTYLDLTPTVQSTPGSERGLLSLAFGPGGKLYAYVTAAGDGRIEVREYSGTNPAPRVLLSVPHPRSNHNGGQLQFGPDGFLYAGTGDGGGGDDPDRQAQDPDSRLGKLLRIDVATGAVTTVSLGLRNPWRFSFAPDGRIVIADVGQSAREEINVGLAANYGWPCREGTAAGNVPDPRCEGIETAAPLLEKTHAGDGFCSITGGYVVRDPGLPTLYGRYVYGDYCNPQLRSVDLTDPASDREIGLSSRQTSSFGEDGCGRLLVVSLGGAVSRVTDGPSTPCEASEPPPAPPPPPPAAPLPVATPPLPPAAPSPPEPAPGATACTVQLRVMVVRSRYLKVALRTDRRCRATVSARHFRRAALTLRPGRRHVVKLRRVKGKTKRVTVTVRADGRTVRAR